MVFVLFFTDVIGIANDKSSICSSNGNGVEPSPNSSYSKPEDELDKLTHRSCSSLGVVSLQNSCYYSDHRDHLISCNMYKSTMSI